ncbi:conserved hypothetical protein [Burkholderiales bacterium]|jgi:hypothetical protein|nr:conserved hypothetical protein [Burkholderiales bacterium]
MKVNVGTPERVVRIIAGIVLIALAVLGTVGPWLYTGIVLLVIGIVLLLTGLVRWCPAWALFGVNTCAVKKP